jgi:hypothetical protein
MFDARKGVGKWCVFIGAYMYIYIVYMLIEHVHHQLFHIHTCADISFAADTIAAFLSRAQT